MRAVKFVTAVAWNLKQEHSKLEECKIFLRALRDISVSQYPLGLCETTHLVAYRFSLYGNCNMLAFVTFVE